MNVLIVTDFRVFFFKGKYYLADTTYTTIKRYKAKFGNVSLCTRVVETDSVEKYIEASDVIKKVYNTGGLFDVFLGKCNSLIKQAVSENDLIISRVPSIAAYKAVSIAFHYKKPVLAVVIGCAWDAYWNHSFIGKLIAPYMFFRMKTAVKKSKYVLYVTSSFLQKRYPTSSLSIGVSDVKISSLDCIKFQKRNLSNSVDGKPISLATIANVENSCKGHRFVIKALAILKKQGIETKYYCVGGGDSTKLLKIAKKYGVEDSLVFTGLLESEKVFDLLWNIDIYIQPSLQEGLCRSIVEAMSCGCPVVASVAGGNGELVSKELLVRKKSHVDIANKILFLLKDSNLSKYSSINFGNAKKYLEKDLDYIINSFYNLIISQIEVDK